MILGKYMWLEKRKESPNLSICPLEDFLGASKHYQKTMKSLVKLFYMRSGRSHSSDKGRF